MQLNLYLFKRKISKTEFAKRLGISREHLHRIMMGYYASMELLEKISLETEGWVKPHDLKPHLKKRKRPQKGPKLIQLDAFE